MDTVIVAEVATEEFTQGTKRHAPLTKWHTYDSTYREDFCSVKMSTSCKNSRYILSCIENHQKFSPDGTLEYVAHDLCQGMVTPIWF